MIWVLVECGLIALILAALFLLGWRLDWVLLSRKTEGAKIIETYGLRPKRNRKTP